ncbi:MAG TPA: ABC transporter ATP-binding protein [Acidimicrobiia bacterium]|jgi:ABC-2 type transport system ATP-binding protein
MVAIDVQDLRKRYGDREVLVGIDLRVECGELVAILGPNGAGKTTTVEILEGLTPRTAGEVSVLGHDPARGERGLRERIGVVLQQGGVETMLTCRELLDLHRGFYPAPRATDELLDLVGLAAQGDERVGRLSGGQQRRIDMALALAGDPELVFLDEPTTGFDPAARHQAWDAIVGLRALGKTIVLTTHYLDEAEALADRVVVLSQGRVVADGPPGVLGDRHTAPSRLTFFPIGGVAVRDLPVAVADDGVRWTITTSDPTATLLELTSWAVREGHELAGLEVTPPSLEEIYLEVTA